MNVIKSIVNKLKFKTKVQCYYWHIWFFTVSMIISLQFTYGNVMKDRIDLSMLNLFSAMIYAVLLYEWRTEYEEYHFTVSDYCNAFWHNSTSAKN